MKIYHKEISDGLIGKLHASRGTILKVKYPKILNKANDSNANIKTLQDLIGTEQKDLSLLVSILVSTGWNLNDDVFLPAEIWQARNTPVHKPINYMHDETIILGHIVSSRAVNKDSTDIMDDKELPLSFDIEVAGVLYKALPKIRDQISDIISKANNGEMFVSMECWFSDFDYAFLDVKTGTTKVVKRNESTAFLTKHLKLMGGTGDFNGNKLGRVLRNINFGGQGIVTNPANPDSVIKIAAERVNNKPFFLINEFNLPKCFQQIEDCEKSQEKTNLKGGVEMSTKADNQVSDTKEVSVDTTVQSKLDESNVKLLDATKEIDKLIAEKTNLLKEIDRLSKTADATSKELEDIKKTTIANERLAKLKALTKIEDEKATLDELRNMTDETFAVVVKYAKKEDKSEAQNKKDDVTDDAEESLSKAEVKDEPAFNAEEKNASDKLAEVAIATANLLLSRKKNDKQKEV